ncbi:ABC transporter permease [Pseudonocardia kunmingensis]|uniref:Fluoroquinolone transport system permease protein n=1 Tax=Pseudonocardia kunmingensis TaxID=630975 RepID=A0A543DKX1_9PSEU|nr:ABC transporter permease [Pseudonocardia kunmingensis]TQM09983.1 fluoroquinolone transport system permease protein [Pseudonocardia kunmingensis]
MSAATGFIATFGRNDLRTVRRDSMLVTVMLGPFLYAAALWFLPALTDYLAHTYSFDLVPYRSAIVSAFCVLGPPLLLGAVLALQLVDERDQNTLAALRVTPVPPSTYPAYRAGMTIALTTFSVLASLAISRQVDVRTLVLGVPVALMAGLLAPVLGFTVSSLGRNKIEALAVMRVIGLAVFTVPMIPFFILDSPWQLAFGILPPYWPVRAFWSAYDGGSYWPYLAVGLLYNAATALLLLRVAARRLR